MTEPLAEHFDDPFIKAARIGADAEVFLGSILGRHIQDRSNKEIQEATLELIEAESNDIDTGKRLRQKIYRAGDALEWLIEAINDAEQARIAIHEQESYE